jgi:hypothetical protein
MKSLKRSRPVMGLELPGVARIRRPAIDANT